MKTFILLLSLLISQPSIAESIDRCCFCVKNNPGERLDAYTERECKTFFDKHSDECGYTKIFEKRDYLSVRPEGIQCTSSLIHGAFDAMPYLVNVPFRFSKGIADAYQSKDVDYDGSSCLLFNDVNKVKAWADELAKASKSTYRISGNQSVGITRTVLFSGPYERESEKSRVTAIISPGKVAIEFGECSKAGVKCGYQPGESAKAEADLNTKFCMLNEKIVEQTCCIKKLSGKFTYGHWSEPDLSCDGT